MKGLLIKDIRLISKNKRMLVIFVCVIAWMFMAEDSDGYGAILAYAAMLAGIFATSTIAQDENGGNMPFLMTLPVMRETYVAEKHIFTIMCAFIASMLSTLGCVLIHINQWQMIAAEAVLSFAVISFYFMVMLPIQFKNAEKSQIALMGLVAFAAIVFLLYGKVAERINSAGIWINLSGVKQATINIVDKVLSGNKVVVGIIFFLIWLACWAVSFLISREIMRRKEF